MSARRCLWASVNALRLYGRNSSVPKPGIHIFQLRSKCNCTSLTSTLGAFLCLASRQAALTVFSMKSSAICRRISSTSSSNCSVGSISRTSSCSLGFVRIYKWKKIEKLWFVESRWCRCPKLTWVDEVSLTVPFAFCEEDDDDCIGDPDWFGEAISGAGVDVCCGCCWSTWFPIFRDIVFFFFGVCLSLWLLKYWF